MRLFVIDDGQLQLLELLAKRLYKEERLNGDAMRNMAQVLDGIARCCKEIPIPEEKDNV